jgi:hypothetical protein
MKDQAKEQVAILAIIIVLFISALYIVSLWGEDIENKNNYPFAREEIRRIRTDREMAD